MSEDGRKPVRSRADERLAFIGRIEHNAFGVIYGSVTVVALLSAIVLAKTFARISSDAVQQRRAFGVLGLYGFSIGWVIYGRAIPGLLHAAFTSSIGVALALITYLLHG